MSFRIKWYDLYLRFKLSDIITSVVLKCALNMEEYDISQQLRTKLAETPIGRLKQKLQGAIESENYALAAKLQDDISKLEAESLAASAKALAHENANYSFRLGQRARHQKFGYRAVVCEMDPVCCESSS